MATGDLVLGVSSVTYYPGVDLGSKLRLSSVLGLSRSDVSFNGAGHLIDCSRLLPAPVYCNLPGSNLPQETTIGSCRIRIVVVRNLFMIVQATVVVQPVPKTDFERLRLAVSRGGHAWEEIISEPGILQIIDSKTWYHNIDKRMSDFLSDCIDNSQLDLGAVIDVARVQVISRLINLNKDVPLKKRPKFDIDNCCRVALIPGDIDQIEVYTDNDDIVCVQGTINKKKDCCDSAEHWGLQAALCISIKTLLDQMANHHEEEARRLADKACLNSIQGIQRSVAERIKERADFLIPAMDAWSRIILQDDYDQFNPLSNLNREIRALESRIVICSSILRDLATIYGE